MVIEWLRFQVAEAARETFIQKDEAVWTAALSNYSGFLGKEVWLNPKVTNEVVFVIHWTSREAWQSVPADVLEKTEKEFAAQMGTNSYRLIESKEYQVRKFARTSKG
jgi:uncharacterized protein (TIGR03792 family)